LSRMKEMNDNVFMVVFYVMNGNCMKQVQFLPDSTVQIEKCVRLSHGNLLSNGIANLKRL
jgi:hypothetical protein